MSPVRRWRADRSGTAGVEFAVVAPAFMALLLGVLQGGMTLWTQFALQQATERAARCASINQSLCGSPTLTQAYAATQTLGRNLPSGSFTVTTQACGSFVSGAYAVQLLAYSVELKAQSCFPK